MVAHLEDQLAVLQAYRSMGSSGEMDQFARRLADKANAAAALDLLNVGERERWKQSARLLTGRRPTGRDAKPARERARLHLGRLASEIDEIVASPRSRERAAAYHGAVLAYKSIGLITDQQALGWLNKLWVAQYRTEPRTRGGGGFRARGTPTLLAGPTGRVAGVRLTALALYDDGILLAWHWDPTRAERPEPEAIPSFLDGRWDEHPLGEATLSDDTGTQYRPDSSSWQPVGYALRNVTIGNAAYTPRLSARARRLQLRIGRDHLSIKVT